MTARKRYCSWFNDIFSSIVFVKKIATRLQCSITVRSVDKFQVLIQITDHHFFIREFHFYVRRSICWALVANVPKVEKKIHYQPTTTTERIPKSKSFVSSKRYPGDITYAAASSQGTPVDIPGHAVQWHIEDTSAVSRYLPQFTWAPFIRSTWVSVCVCRTPIISKADFVREVCWIEQREIARRLSSVVCQREFDFYLSAATIL